MDVPPDEHAVVGRAMQRAETYKANHSCLRLNHPFDLAQFVGRGKHAAYTFFETTHLRPIERHHLSQLDLLFLPSAWAARVVEENGVSVPTCTLHPGVDASIFNPQVLKAQIPCPTPRTTVFLNVGKWELRKGHDFLLEAFSKAFTPTDDVLLVMCCFNPLTLPGFDGPAQSAEWNRHYMRSPMGVAGKVLVVEGRLPDQQAVASLMAASDAGVFPARGEGWNLDAVEMMAIGKPVVLTDYAAHTEFSYCTPYLIDRTTMEKAFDGFFFRGDVGDWMRLGPVQMDQTVAHLRDIHRRKGEGILCPAPEAEEFVRANTWNAAAQRVIQCLS